MSFGFIGAGEIAAAIVEGLSEGAAAPPEIFLSPRGRSRELADRFPNVTLCESNQQVVDRTAAVVLAVRTTQGEEVLSELSFTPEHVLISALAGVPDTDLLRWAAPVEQVVRVIPLPQAARRQSLTVTYPDHPVTRELFEPVGGVLVPQSDAELAVFGAATTTFAAHLDYLATISEWMAAQGVDSRVATDYVRHIFAAVGAWSADSSLPFTELARGHATPGGNNERVLAELREQQVPEMVRTALDRILTRLRG
ncbi:pyrroline-5-carboxylate reductase [Pseudonocardiaceae bacterium YIM PH 21723]|nr:pyrroline-5-carboxylate reductase [Pseudonocardiaceae bacterium YIM PH 21723]